MGKKISVSKLLLCVVTITLVSLSTSEEVLANENALVEVENIADSTDVENGYNVSYWFDEQIPVVLGRNYLPISQYYTHHIVGIGHVSGTLHPVNPNAYNGQRTWRYRGTLTRRVNNNPIPLIDEYEFSN